MQEEMIFYRYETEVCHHPYFHIEINLRTFKMIKETPKGYWIAHHWDVEGMDSKLKRWVSKDSRKRFAYPDKKLAMMNYIRRTEKYISILKTKLEDARSGLKLAMEKVNGRQGKSTKECSRNNGCSIF